MPRNTTYPPHTKAGQTDTDRATFEVYKCFFKRSRNDLTEDGLFLKSYNNEIWTADLIIDKNGKPVYDIWTYNLKQNILIL